MLKIESKQSDHHTTLFLSGKLVAGAVPHLTKLVDERRDADDAVTLDLRELLAVDRQALGCLLELRRTGVKLVHAPSFLRMWLTAEWRALFHVLLLAGIVFACARRAGAQELTLDDAIATALAQNRNIAIARLEAAKSAERARVARTRRLPALTIDAIAAKPLTPLRFEFEAGEFGTYPDVGPIPSRDTSVALASTLNAIVTARVSQPISQLHEIGVGIRLADEAKRFDDVRVAEAEQTVANAVAKAYFDVQKSTSALSAANSALVFLRELDAQVARYVQQGRALPADALEVQARLAKAEHDVAALQQVIGTQKRGLNLLLGRDAGSPVNVLAPAATALAMPAGMAAEAGAATRRPDVQQRGIRVLQARDDLRLKQAEGIPGVALVVTYVAPVGVDLLPRSYSSAALVAQWDPFTWGRRKSELAEKRHAVEQAVASLREQEAQAEIEISAARAAVTTAESLIAVREKEQAAARERRRVAADRFRLDAALLRDVLEADAKLAAADNDHNEALAAYANAVADLNKALGGTR